MPDVPQGERLDGILVWPQNRVKLLGASRSRTRGESITSQLKRNGDLTTSPDSPVCNESELNAGRFH